MPKIKFLEKRVTKNAKARVFEAGRVYEVSDSAATHWISRGAAVLVDESRGKQSKEDSPPETEESHKAAEKPGEVKSEAKPPTDPTRRQGGR